MPTEVSRRELEGLLVELHAPVDPPEPEPRREREALDAWAARYEGAAHEEACDPDPPRVGALLLATLAAHRLAAALGAFVFVVVAACVMPTTYDIPLGLSVEITVAGEELPVREIGRFVRERSEAAEVDMLVRQVVLDDGESQTHMKIRLWDQDLALGDLEPQLREAFPAALAEAEIVEDPLEGEVDTIWGRRLAHRAFRLALKESSVEAAREELITQLRAEGYADEEVVVKVRDRPDGHREIRVEIQRELPGDEEG